MRKITHQVSISSSRGISLLVVLMTITLLVGFVATGSGGPTGRPSDDWTIHIDAKKHFPSNPEVIAHHYCKAVAGGLIECQLYDSDASDARLVGVEMVVDTQTYNSFSAQEKALWHYHKTEIPKVEATLPDMTPEEAAKLVKSLEETYGKIYILWDPGASNVPVGNPSVFVLDSNATTGPNLSDLWWVVIVAIAVILAAGWFVIKKRSKAAR